MNYIIITGASRGLGNAIVRKLMDKRNHIFCISRNRDNSLISLFENQGCRLDYFEFDLNNTAGLDSLMDNIFGKIEISDATSVSLINNAGMLAPIKPAPKCSSSEIINNINVNLVAPMILTSAFARNTTNFNIEKRVVNISSGAGKKPYFGWSCYCSSKAGLDLFTQCIGVEQQKQKYPVKIISFAPGIIDTGMQEQIRSSSVEDFEQLDRFIDLNKEGKLLSPDFVAKKVVDLLFSPDFIQGGVIDIRDKC